MSMAEVWKRAAIKWRRMALDDDTNPRPHVSIDPSSRTGHPTIVWRIPAETPCSVLWDGYPMAWILQNYPTLTRPHVLVAAWYLATYGSRTWKKRWGVWAKDNFGHLWAQRYDECPDPPTVETCND